MLTRLVVLGCLMQWPMSGYQIQLILQVSQTEQWAGILPGSVYHALKKLETEGMVILKETEKTGNRLKSIYEITPEGKDEFTKLLKEAWQKPCLHFPANIYGALSFLNSSQLDEVLPLIDTQIVMLKAELDEWNNGETAKKRFFSTELPDYIKAIFENGRKHIELDIEFLKKLQQTLPEEKLTGGFYGKPDIQ
ncbi:MAG: PadR family transcriptional regulator [Treponema sp.]|nr:PadR family transcriptional regulator [Treponema sp.]